LGQRTAEFHLALAKEQKHPDFKPEKAGAEFSAQLAETVVHQVQSSLALLSSRITGLPEEIRRVANRVLSQGSALLGRTDRIAGVGRNMGSLIRLHGDYHLGQVLRTEDRDFILLDFEGEPLRPLAERRRKGSAMKDVAGMIRSLHYAAHTALSAQHVPAEEKAGLKPWSRAWYEWMSAVFADTYFQTAAGGPFLPTADTPIILEAFLLEKAFYELKYELNNRPDWVHIPLAGIVDIMDRKKKTRRKK
jgi:maltose alpha-D-glucosyltransferase/alpha-amylase